MVAVGKGDMPMVLAGQQGRATLARIWFLALALWSPLAQPAFAGEKRPSTVEVRLPADAELKLNGVKTRATGEVRRFESPPLEAGSTYAYTLQATWRGRRVTREVTLQPGRPVVVDLRQELEAVAPPGSVSLRVPPAVTLEAGDQAFLAVHVQGDNLKDPVTLSFSGLPRHVEVAPMTTGSGRDDTWRGVVKAGAAAEAATVAVKVHARSGKARAEVPFQLVITRTNAAPVRSQAARPNGRVGGVMPPGPRRQAAVREHPASQGKQPARLTVHVPADAEVEVDGAKSGPAGEARYFESPPLQAGGTYSCAVKVSWRGWEVSRQVLVRPGEEVTVDLRRQLQAMEAPPAKPSVQPVSRQEERPSPAPAPLRLPDDGVGGPLLPPITTPGANAPSSPNPGVVPARSGSPLPQSTPSQAPLQTSAAQPAPLPFVQVEDEKPKSAEAEPPSTVKVVHELEVYPVLPAEPSKLGVSNPASPTLPDRWFLMKSLQGTGAGSALVSERLSVSGWTEASFTASSVKADQLPMGFNYLANQVALQQNWLRVERFVVTSGTTEPTFGFRSDTILPGTDYRFTISRGLFSGQLTANDGFPNTYGIDPVQFYGEAYFPTIGRGLDVKVGRMFCQYGAESIDGPPNALASRSYAFIYDPFTHTGVMGTLYVTPAWSFQLGAIMGPDVFIDPAASPYGMFSVKWAPPGGRDSVLVSGLFGSGRFNQAEAFNNPNIIDLVWVHTINARLTYTLDTLFGYQTNIPDIGTATWFSFVNYLTCKFTPRLSGTTRLEFFNDIDGNRTGFKGLYTALTLGLNFQPIKDVIFRPEVRYDYNTESRPFQGQHGVVTGAADLIVRW